MHLGMVLILGLTALYLGGMEEGGQENNMEKDTTIANVVTLGAVGMTVMGTIQILTILSLLTAIGLNLIMIYKSFNEKK